ncbi:salutaridinol 7-O-acetyltransferase-like [Punica granatum]|uniref:Uncharacterized protein n=2 Tax=Punica granatum TaxID=22663 RepID=A0A218WW25_PUNGR|nr:salutaridinol 7-O-acetyltransferase-like [Punica granatum]OWM76182.1 hypothetical protein CDL15_Pgr009828 [Punica granatum]PKI77042.1 hypothetical protein CRG98_002545 [Punica granatum]
MKVEVVSTETIWTSRPTPEQLRNFKLSLLDQLATPLFIPIVPFYSVEDFGTDCGTAPLLPHTPPGSIPDRSAMQRLMPLDPYNVPITRNFPSQRFRSMFSTVGVLAIGACISHKVADGATLSSCLNMWSAIETSNGRGGISLAPHLDSTMLFPPIDINLKMPRRVMADEKMMTMRFVFEGKRLALPRSQVGVPSSTRVEAVTTLLRKSAMVTS